MFDIHHRHRQFFSRIMDRLADWHKTLIHDYPGDYQCSCEPLCHGSDGTWRCQPDYATTNIGIEIKH